MCSVVSFFLDDDDEEDDDDEDDEDKTKEHLNFWTLMSSRANILERIFLFSGISLFLDYCKVIGDFAFFSVRLPDKGAS